MKADTSEHFNFYPRSPCGERHHQLANRNQDQHFYPRSPCGERQDLEPSTTRRLTFLSTLSLRRATPSTSIPKPGKVISIHALLAESDTSHSKDIDQPKHFYPRSPCGERPGCQRPCEHPTKISIHALLAESDHHRSENLYPGQQFLSTLSLRRATFFGCQYSFKLFISIHALLAESDSCTAHNRRSQKHFYPRSPCGERRYILMRYRISARYFYPRSPCGERRELV